MSWGACILRKDKEKSVSVLNAPFSNYYAQKEMDDGFDMTTDISIDEVIGYVFRAIIDY